MLAAPGISVDHAFWWSAALALLPFVVTLLFVFAVVHHIGRRPG